MLCQIVFVGRIASHPFSDEEAELYGGEAGVAADACYHLACDDRTNVDPATARLFGQAVAAVVGELAY